MADSDWSQEEIDSSVKAYLGMLNKEIRGENYNKAEINRQLREEELTSRSRCSIEMRMCNISTVLNDAGNKYINGYKPRQNVGANVYPMIEAAIKRFEPSQISPVDKSTKEGLMHRICKLCGILPHDVRKGSTAPMSFFEDVANSLGLSPLGEETKHGLAKHIVKSLDQKWDKSCYSDGGTVTQIALERIEKGLRLSGRQETNKKQSVHFPTEIPFDKIQLSIDRIDRDGPAPHKASHTYDVVVNDRSYPPPAVVAFALEEMGHQIVSPGTIRAGKGTRAFKLLADAGFEPVSKHTVPTDDDEILENRVNDLLLNSDLLDEAFTGSDTPPDKSEKTASSYKRNAGVIATILRLAGGTCELCLAAAPFRRPDGHLYLEVHHVQFLAEGGLDNTKNAVALCPNCHCRCHYSEETQPLADRLYRQVNRLKKPSSGF